MPAHCRDRIGLRLSRPRMKTWPPGPRTCGRSVAVQLSHLSRRSFFYLPEELPPSSLSSPRHCARLLAAESARAVVESGQFLVLAAGCPPFFLRWN